MGSLKRRLLAILAGVAAWGLLMLAVPQALHLASERGTDLVWRLLQDSKPERRVVVIDALSGTQREVPLAAADSAPVTAAPMAAAAPPEIAELTAGEMLAAQEAGATLFDVREPWETESGIVAGSVVIPLGDFLDDPGLLDEHRDDDGPVVVICAHGIRARTAAEVLQTRGIDASILTGGLAQWQRA